MLAKHLKIWLAGLLVVFLAVPIIATPTEMWSNAKSELLMLQGAFGQRHATRLASSATSIYNAAFVETGLVGTLERGKATRREQEQGEAVLGTVSSALSAISGSYLDTLSALFYIATVRVLILLTWAPFVLPFIGGAFSEGVARRKIKYATFGQYGAVYYAGAMHASVVIAGLPVVYLLAPFAITPFFMPFWAVAAAIPVITAIANASQIRPK